MTDNIVEFKPRKFEQVYECECGCQHFFMLISMEIECRCCGKTSGVLFLTTEQPNADNTPTTD